MGCHFLLQRIFPTLGSNPGLPHCRQTLYRLSHRKFILVTGIFQVSDINFASQAPSLWVVVHLLSHVRLFNPMDCMQHARLPCPSLSPGICSNSCPLSWWCHLTLCRPLLLLPSIFPSFRVFFSESALCIRWPKYWSFSFSISPSKEYSGLISFRIDWFDLLAVQGTLKSLLEHHSSKASILWCSAFFMAQLSHPYMTTGKTIP